MNEKPPPNGHDVDTGSSADPDSASMSSVADTEAPRKWDLFHQFVESMPIKPSDLRNFARFAPLVSAVLAPISTLLDIPALTVSPRQQIRTPHAHGHMTG